MAGEQDTYTEEEGDYPFSERLFLLLAGVFLAAMVCMNVLGITRFIRIGGWEFTAFGQKLTVLDLAIGVLPYPVTFLATDIISELYGRRRASFVVWVGFLLNVFLLLVCWLGQLFPAPFDAHGALWKQAWVDMGGSGVPSTLPPPDRFYGQVWLLMSGATAASMVAYLAAQLVDVHLFHYWKRVTKGKHLWLRNHGSTLVSQLFFPDELVRSIFAGEPLYDGSQSEWVMEEIDISEYLGNGEVYIRFRIDTDGFVNQDGFYFDDPEVVILAEPVTGASEGPGERLPFLQLYPSPFSAQFQTDFSLAERKDRVQARLLTPYGQLMAEQELREVSAIQRHRFTFEEDGLPNGVYLLQILADGELVGVRKVVKAE